MIPTNDPLQGWERWYFGTDVSPGDAPAVPTCDATAETPPVDTACVGSVCAVARAPEPAAAA